jgi:uncharacterized membrane protein
MTSLFKSLNGATPRSSTLAGILFMLAAVTIFSLVNVFSKMMVAAYPPAQLFFIRGFAAIATLLPFLARDNFAAVRNVQRPGLQVLRMTLSVADGMLFFTAIKYIPLADATPAISPRRSLSRPFPRFSCASRSAGGAGRRWLSVSSAC